MECGAREYQKLEKALRESASKRAVSDRWGAAKFCEGWALCLWELEKLEMDYVKIMNIISKLHEEGLVE